MTIVVVNQPFDYTQRIAVLNDNNELQESLKVDYNQVVDTTYIMYNKYKCDKIQLWGQTPEFTHKWSEELKSKYSNIVVEEHELR